MAPKRTRAAKGQAVSPKAISGMLTMLRYKRDSGKDKEKAAGAEAAMTVHEQLVQPEEREAFLKEFEMNGGGGKQPGSLKFALTFRQRLRETFQVEASAVENWLTRPS